MVGIYFLLGANEKPRTLASIFDIVLFWSESSDDRWHVRNESPTRKIEGAVIPSGVLCSRYGDWTSDVFGAAQRSKTITQQLQAIF